MIRDPLDLPASASRARRAAEAAALPPPAQQRAVEIAIATPDAREWASFLSRALALLGTGLVLAGVICFIAYNWTRFGRLAKFALVELAIVGATIYAWRALPKLTGRVALFAASVLAGGLLALYGQTYQTGADPYELFLTWSWMILPWVIVARFAALWLLEIALIDLTLSLYWFQVLGVKTGREFLVLPLLIALLHALGVVVWEWQCRRPTPWITERWATRVVALAGFFALWLVAMMEIIPNSGAGLTGIIGLVALAGTIALARDYYRRTRPDRFMVTMAVATGMAWVTVLVGRIVFSELKLETLGLFLMAGFVVWEITLGLSWFRRITPPPDKED